MNITSKQLKQLKAGQPLYAKEGELVKDCITRLTKAGCFVWKQNQGGMKVEGKGQGRFIKFAHVEGISDIIGMTPTGRFLAVECKMVGNKPTKKQQDFLEAVADSGGLAVVAYSADALMELKELKELL